MIPSTEFQSSEEVRPTPVNHRPSVRRVRRDRAQRSRRRPVRSDLRPVRLCGGVRSERAVSVDPATSKRFGPAQRTEGGIHIQNMFMLYIYICLMCICFCFFGKRTHQAMLVGGSRCRRSWPLDLEKMNRKFGLRTTHRSCATNQP